MAMEVCLEVKNDKYFRREGNFALPYASFFSITFRIGIIDVLDQKHNRKKVKSGERKMGERLEGDS